MKTRFWQRLFVVALIGCATPLRAADNDEPKPAVPPDDASTAKSPAAINAPPAVAQPNPNAAPVAIIPPKLSLPPLLDQVVRLSQSGTDESVVRAYVEKAAPAYRITGNEIIQLQDLGVSKAVILALIEHSKTAMPSEAAVSQPAPSAAPPANVPPPATDEATSDYYDALAPYGSWAYLPSYGWCWQPSVAVVNTGWRPYCDNGYWLWSDCGWYWNSYYSWGWAPFHYGRWFCHGNNSWYWCPDRVWGPAWVCWRNSATHCGWAPLPPGACFTAGVGWTHNGVRVGVGFGFGIASVNFNFVSHGHFADHNVSQHTLRGHDANTAFAQTKVINNYTMGANNRPFNQGVGREQIAAARGAPIQTVSVSESARHGSAMAGRTFIGAASRSQPTITRQAAFQQSRTATASVAPQTSPTVSTFAGQRALPNYSVPNRAAPVQQSRSGYSAAAPRVNAAPQIQPRYSTSINRNTVAPRASSTPSVAQRQFSPQTFAARPSFQGHAPSFAGSASRGTMSAGHGGGGMSVGRSSFAGRH